MDLLSDEVGKKELLLGNEAIVRGAIEAGVAIATTYPGTPSSEIGNTLFRIAKDAGMYFEFSVNEKVATEIAVAAAASEVRAMAFMKHVGLNVAADAFMTAATVGVRGGMVLISADDPSCHSSQNEQDNRYYAYLANVPMLEPATPQEAKDMVVYGFDLSENLQLPVLIRTTTRVNHVRGVVTYGPKKPIKKIGRFEKDPERFVTVPATARRRHPVQLKSMEEARRISEASEYNKIMGTGEYGVITSGAAYNYVMEVVEEKKLNISVLKLGMTHPVPRELIASFMKDKKAVIVVEELEPYLEKEAHVAAKQHNLTIPIYGKYTGHFPRLFEYDVDIVGRGICKALGLNYNPENLSLNVNVPPRPPVLCPGCPHRSAYYAAKQVFGKDEVIYSMDIGCYTLGVQPPLLTADYLICMGSSVGAAGGFAKATGKTVIAVIGDSTFFHAGIPGLVNALYNKHKFIYLILDNRTTAMTGHQPNPGMGITGMGETSPEISIEGIVRGVGIEFVRTVDPHDLETMKQAFKDAKEHDGVAVIIAKRPCALLEVREKRKKGTMQRFTVNQEKCRQCYICTDKFSCPAIYKKDGKVYISEILCSGCGVCMQVCPFKAIEVVK